MPVPIQFHNRLEILIYIIIIFVIISGGVVVKFSIELFGCHLYGNRLEQVNDIIVCCLYTQPNIFMYHRTQNAI